MREIKFRFWYEEEKLMEEEGEGFSYLDGGFIVLGAGWKSYVDTYGIEKKFIPMQFTGLLDKNGKEIYEGDIVEDDLKQKEPVIMEFGQWRVYGRSLFQESNAKRIEIKGNIYENSELLPPLKEKE